MQAIEIAIQYGTLLRLNVSHNFFGQEKPAIFLWQPAEETNAFLRQIGVLTRYQDDSVVLLASSAHQASMRKVLQETPSFTLSFALYSENPYFTHFSDLPLELKGKAFYFHNQQDKNKTNLLHAGEYATQQDMLPLSGNKFMLGEQKTGTVCTLEHSHLPEKREIEVDTYGNLIVDFGREPFGKYALTSKSKTDANFLYAPYKVGKTLVGWADITISEELSKTWIANLDHEEKVATQVYQVKFETRSTFWRYYFIPKYAGNLNHTEIESNGLGLQFEPPKQVTLPNGLEAICFEAKKAMPLQKKINGIMQLVRKKDSKGNAIRQVLCKVPQPNYEGLRAASRQLDAKTFSEIIIYV